VVSNIPSNTDDIIDSRDVIARIEELEGEREALADEVSEADEDDLDAAVAALEEWDRENAEELKILKDLQDECNYGDWQHGETLIRDSYFEDYAQQLAEDIGAINHSAGWPNNCIDWDRATSELQMDYSLVSFDGVDYWIRS
jgi:hypothetical protein